MTAVAERWTIGADHPVPARARLRQSARQFAEWASRLGHGIDQGAEQTTAEQAQLMRSLLVWLMQTSELEHLTDLVEDLAAGQAQGGQGPSFTEWERWVHEAVARTVLSVPERVAGVETGPGVTVWDGRITGPAGWCGDCGGTGGRLDVDGSFTGEIGRPIVCGCTIPGHLVERFEHNLDEWRQHPHVDLVEAS